LEKVYVGHSKDSFSVVEINHNVSGVCGMFGSFVKFIVVLADLELEQQAKRYKAANAPSNGLPRLISERTRKDKLYNAIVTFLATRKLGWSDPDEFGKHFIQDMCNVLWYIDGHYEVFASRSCPIPTVFNCFVGFNRLELSKHRKRSISNMSKDKLQEYSCLLQNHAMSSWMQQQDWASFKESFLNLIESLSAYVSYLSIRNKSMKIHHASSEPVSFSDSSCLKFINATSKVLPLLSALNEAVTSSPYYHKLFVKEYSPDDKRRRYLFIQELEKGLTSSIFLFTYTHHSNVGNYHFVWKAPTPLNERASTCENLRIIEEIKKEIPVYHTRAMKKEFFNLYGRFSPESKPYMLRTMYRALTNDSSASRTTAENEIDERIKEALLVEDFDIIVDLRQLNATGVDNFGVFWSKCNEFLNTCTCVHERRHGTATFMAKAISIRDLIQQVAQMCPSGTPIPSESWTRFNFFPQNPRAHAAKHYRGRLEAKHMVQKRQFRKTHPDAHYCAALFKYMRQYAIKLRDLSHFICIDDKHRIKVGEPGFPISAIERGREVIVSLHDTFVTGDHDFTKFSLIPSVALLVNIPETIDGSWYDGQVSVSIKDAIYEPSSPFRHSAELNKWLITKMAGRSVLFLYADGGPDHRLSFVSVQLSLLALFISLDLDMLIAGQTAPSHSWANPVERIMAIINLGLQCIGVMRKQMGEEVEKVLASCGNLKELRGGCVGFKNAIVETLEPVKELISHILQRLELKGKKFTVTHSSSESEINEMWELLLNIEPLLTMENLTRKSLEKLPTLNNFMKHCCTFAKYSLTIKKCGQIECSLCTPVKMPLDIFSSKLTVMSCTDYRFIVTIYR
jgi:hypothetical protein